LRRLWTLLLRVIRAILAEPVGGVNGRNFA
jgi:hypothetical protein